MLQHQFYSSALWSGRKLSRDRKAETNEPHSCPDPAMSASRSGDQCLGLSQGWLRSRFRGPRFRRTGSSRRRRCASSCRRGGGSAGAWELPRAWARQLDSSAAATLSAVTHDSPHLAGPQPGASPQPPASQQQLPGGSQPRVRVCHRASCVGSGICKTLCYRLTLLDR